MEKATALIEEILQPGKSVQIEFTNDHGYKIITKSMVYQLDEKLLMLEFPKKQDAFNFVSSNTKIAVVCRYNDEPRDYVFFTSFVELKGTDPAFVILVKPDAVFLGRYVLRYDVKIPFSYFSNDKEHKEGEVDNLSTIGLLAIIKPDANLKEGMGIPIKITLPTTANPLLIIGNIVRIVKNEQEYRVAFSFPHINIELQDQIAKFLFSNQKTGAKKEPQKSAFIKINN